MFKKFIAMILCVAMVLSTMGFNVIADTDEFTVESATGTEESYGEGISGDENAMQDDTEVISGDENAMQDDTEVLSSDENAMQDDTEVISGDENVMRDNIEVLSDEVVTPSSVTASSIVTASPSTSVASSVILIDTSSSMSWYVSGSSKMDKAKELAKDYAEKLFEKNKKAEIAVVSFSDDSEIVIDFSNDLNKIISAINGVFTGVNTGMSYALKDAVMLLNGKAKNCEVYLISDGLPQHGEPRTNGEFDKYKAQYPDILCIEYMNYCYDYAKSNIHNKNCLLRTSLIYDVDDEYYELAEAFMEKMQNPLGNNEDSPYKGDEYITTTEEEEETETTTRASRGGSVVIGGTGTVNPKNEKTDKDDTYESDALKNYSTIDSYNIDSVPTAVDAVESLISEIKTDDISKLSNDDVKDGIALFAEEAIGRAVKQTVGTDINITSELTEELSKKAKDASEKINTAIKDSGASLDRTLLIDANFVSESDNAVIKVDKDIANTGLDNIHIDINGARLTIPSDDITGNDEDYIVSIETVDNEENDVAQDNEETAAVNAKAVKLTGIKSGSVVSLKTLSDVSTKYQAVKGPDGICVSKVDTATRLVQGKATASGTYYVVNNPVNFNDVANLTAAQREVISTLASRGIISGKTASSFAPNDTLTRAEFATLVLKCVGAYNQNYSGTGNFKDVNSNDWYAPVASKAKATGIISGYSSDNTFRADLKINNEQMYHILGLTMSKVDKKYTVSDNEVNNYISKFNDKSAIGLWANKYVALSKKLNVIPGNKTGNFNPRDEVRRYAAADAINNFVNRIPFEKSL